MAKRQIRNAFWTAPGEACFFLAKDWELPEAPDVCLDADELYMHKLRPMEKEYLGRYTGYYGHEDFIVFCLDPAQHPQIDFTKTTIRVAGTFNHWGKNALWDEWVLEAPENDAGTLWTCKVHRDRVIHQHKTTFKFVTEDDVWINPMHCAPNINYDKAGNSNYILHHHQSKNYAFQFEVTGGRGINTKTSLVLETNGHIERTLLVPGLSFFELKTELPLGAIISDNKTIFRLFAPRATKVYVDYFKEMERPDLTKTVELLFLEDEHTWETTISQNLEGFYYYFRVDGVNDNHSTRFNPDMKILDPYALATVNAEGPGIVINAKKLPKPNKGEGEFKTPFWQNLIIVEGHIRDLTTFAPVDLPEVERRGFIGLAKWINNGGCYLKKLGANTLELQPIQQSDSKLPEEYHWGYMTTNYFSPCSHYASKPEKASQIQEFHTLIETCHKNGLAVILDVVYNHVGEPAFLQYIDKQYYLYTDKKGKLINWSGCGNTVRANAAMAKRLIIDSLLHLVKTFNVDGFRFDLAELLGVEILKAVELELKKVKPDLILVAEPWSFRGGMIRDLKYTGFAFWNDGFRDFMASYVKGKGDASGLYYYMKGSLDYQSSWPAQSINYVESHDDRCWIDKITENQDHNGYNPTINDIHRTHLMLGILMCSIGTPLLSAGQDFLRSKGGRNNTYQRGDLNIVDYQRINHYGLSHYYFQQWIRFRNSHWGDLLKLWENPSPGYIRLYEAPKHSSAAALLFNADFSQGGRQLLFAVNPHTERSAIPIYDLANEGWHQLANQNNFNFEGIFDGRLNLYDWNIYLEPLNLGLWVRG